MALQTPGLPYGIRDIKVTPYLADGTLDSTSVDLPIARTLTFEEAEDFEDLRGDDKLQASRGNGPTVNWDLEAGGISLDALKVIAGGTVTSSGVTPNVVKTFAKKASDSRPYFKIEGQAISDNGGDVHVIIYKVKVTGTVTGEFSDGAFFLTGASGKAFDNGSDKLYDFVRNETAASIA